jgi:hypothetical protein
MYIAYVTVSVITAAANLSIAVADFLQVRYVLANMAEVGVPRSWLPVLATLKAAGAVGLLLGLAGVDVIGVAAAAGLVLFCVGAVATHVATRVYHNIAVPGGFLALAVASLALSSAG